MKKTQTKPEKLKKALGGEKVSLSSNYATESKTNTMKALSLYGPGFSLQSS